MAEIRAWVGTKPEDAVGRVMGLTELPAEAPLRFILGRFVRSFVSIATNAVLLRALGIVGHGDAFALPR